MNYPFMIYFSMVPNFGRLPTMMMHDLNNRPPAQTDRAVNKNIPIKPTMGCHIGIVTGVACLISINIGVNGGNNEAQVAKAPNGF